MRGDYQGECDESTELAQGQGEATGADRYVGHFVKGKPDGKGTYTWANGARIEVSFPGVTLGVFSGRLQFTVYRGANLIRQEIIAKTDAPSVAYKYDAGLAGLAIGPSSRVLWRGMTNLWQDYHLGSAPSEAPVTLKSSNRMVAESPAIDRGISAAPHVLLGAGDEPQPITTGTRQPSFAFGVRQAERRESEDGVAAPTTGIKFRAAQRPARLATEPHLRKSCERAGTMDGVREFTRRSLLRLPVTR
jgi:hypothetical protein